MAVETFEVTAGGDASVTTNNARYLGGVMHDLTGDGNVKVYHGAAATLANLIDVIACSDEVQAAHSLAPGQGIYCPGGIYVDITNGDACVIWYEPEGAASPLGA